MAAPRPAGAVRAPALGFRGGAALRLRWGWIRFGGCAGLGWLGTTTTRCGAVAAGGLCRSRLSSRRLFGFGLDTEESDDAVFSWDGKGNGNGSRKPGMGMRR